MSGELILQAFLVSLAYLICFGGNWLLGQNMADQPIVVGPLVGLFLGDLQSGLIIGATLQAVFMGVINAGGAVSLNPSFGTALGVAFAILSHGGQEVAMVLAIPLGLLGGLLEVGMNTGASFFGDAWDAAAQDGNAKKIVRLHYGVWAFKYLVFSLVIFLAVIAGADVVTKFVENLPDFIVDGLGVVSGLLPAVGFGMLIQFIWSKEIAIFYFVGFVLVAYLKLPLIALAIIGLAVAITVGLFESKLTQLKNVKAIDNAGDYDEEEDFFL